jgi:hypothetical protein
MPYTLTCRIMSSITEKTVSALWLSGRLSHFSDDSGHSIQVICPGRGSTRGGCDFQDVVITVNGEKTVGDVEVHLTSDLWQRHGHHRDAAYNGVILHVSMWQRGFLPVRLQDGRTLPTVILGQYIKISRDLLQGISGRPHLRCPSLQHAGKHMDRIIVQAGLSRFAQKSAAFAQALKVDDPEQVLYKGVCRALGYSRNVKPFEMLAGRVTAGMVRDNTAGSLPAKHVLLMGAAGLLPALKGELSYLVDYSQISGTQAEWSHILQQVRPMNILDWSFAYIRPSNHPVRRISGLCHLLHRHEDGGLLPHLVDLIDAAQPSKAAYVLEGAFKVADHCISGCSGHADGRFDAAALIGPGRAREIVVNAVLSFIPAYAANIKNGQLGHKAGLIYGGYPSLPQNELTRYMGGLLGNQAYGACRQQGLLHIYHTWCRTRECATCPVVMSRKTTPV